VYNAIINIHYGLRRSLSIPFISMIVEPSPPAAVGVEGYLDLFTGYLASPAFRFNF